MQAILFLVFINIFADLSIITFSQVPTFLLKLTLWFFAVFAWLIDVFMRIEAVLIAWAPFTILQDPLYLWLLGWTCQTFIWLLLFGLRLIEKGSIANSYLIFVLNFFLYSVDLILL